MNNDELIKSIAKKINQLSEHNYEIMLIVVDVFNKKELNNVY